MRKLFLIMILILLFSTGCGNVENSDNPIDSDNENTIFYGLAGNNEIITKYLISGNQKVKIEVSFETGIKDFKINESSIDIEGYWITTLSIVDDVIVMTVAGNDIRDMHFYAYSLDGTKLVDVYNLDENGMYICEIKIENKKIFLYGTRIVPGPKMIFSDNPTEDILYDSEAWHLMDNNDIVSAIHEIEYLGNRKFTERKMKEIIQTVDIYNEYMKSPWS